MSRSGEWVDSRHVDILYAPIMSLSNALPPTIVEIQNVVDKPFIHRLQKYCNHIYENHNNIEPIALTFCIKMTRTEIAKDFQNTDKGPFLKKLPSDYWASQHLIMTPSTVDGHLNEPLDPLAALEYVFMKQKCSLLGLELRNDATVKQLYLVAKEVLDREVRPHEATVVVLADVCAQTQKQFKRILEAIDEDGPSSKRARKYAGMGIMYTETCLHKYKRQCSSESSMKQPLDLSEGVSPTVGRQEVQVMSIIEPEKQKRDLDVVAEFITEYMKTNKRMNWRQCYDEGRADGYYKNYKDANTLKATYHQVRSKNKN